MLNLMGKGALHHFRLLCLFLAHFLVTLQIELQILYLLIKKLLDSMVLLSYFAVLKNFLLTVLAVEHHLVLAEGLFRVFRVLYAMRQARKSFLLLNLQSSKVPANFYFHASRICETMNMLLLLALGLFFVFELFWRHQTHFNY